MPSSMLLYIFNGAADSSSFLGVEVSASLLLVCVGLHTQVWDDEINIFVLSGCLSIYLVPSVHDFKHIGHLSHWKLHVCMVL